MLGMLNITDSEPASAITGNRLCINCVGKGGETFMVGDVTYPRVTNSIYSSYFPTTSVTRGRTRDVVMDDTHRLDKKAQVGPPPIHLIFFLSLFMGKDALTRFIMKGMTLSRIYLARIAQFVVWSLPLLVWCPTFVRTHRLDLV